MRASFTGTQSDLTFCMGKQRLTPLPACSFLSGFRWVAVIRKEDDVLEALFFCVFLQQGALGRDLSRINSPKQRLWMKYAAKRHSMDFYLSTEHDFGGEHAILIGKRTGTAVFFCNMAD